jgi:hypothetical protein
VEANKAAAKSRAAREAGIEESISTLVSRDTLTHASMPQHPLPAHRLSACREAAALPAAAVAAAAAAAALRSPSYFPLPPSSLSFLQVPDRSRLLPPLPAARPQEQTWVCTHCQHVHAAPREFCGRCHCRNTSFVKENATRDVLSCTEEEMLRCAREKNHPSLNRAFLDAGTPWNQGQIGGVLS